MKYSQRPNPQDIIGRGLIIDENEFNKDIDEILQSKLNNKQLISNNLINSLNNRPDPDLMKQKGLWSVEQQETAALEFLEKNNKDSKEKNEEINDENEIEPISPSKRDKETKASTLEKIF